jgi:hypothetical protein
MVGQIALALFQLAQILWNSKVKDETKRKEIEKRINELVDWLRVGAPNAAELRKDHEEVSKLVQDEWLKKWSPGVTPPGIIPGPTTTKGE